MTRALGHVLNQQQQKGRFGLYSRNKVLRLICSSALCCFMWLFAHKSTLLITKSSSCSGDALNSIQLLKCKAASTNVCCSAQAPYCKPFGSQYLCPVKSIQIRALATGQISWQVSLCANLPLGHKAYMHFSSLKFTNSLSYRHEHHWSRSGRRSNR